MRHLRELSIACVAGFILNSSALSQERALSSPPDSPAQMQPGIPPQAPVRRPNANRSAEGLRVPDDIEVVRDVIYASAPDKDGNPIDLKMDAAFLKETDGDPMPVIVYIHGGGWRVGTKELGLRPSVALAMGGYFAVSIQYRLTDQATYPAAVLDGKAAIRFLREHAEELGIDPQRIGVWGHSAGGHLAALLGTSGNSDVFGDDGKSGVQCVVDISGPTDLTVDAPQGMISQWLGGPVRDHQDLAKQASPMTYIDASDPPFLIIHGTEDRLVNIHRHAQPFEKALKDAGVKVEMLAVEGAGHGVGDPRAYIRTAEFFDEHLGGKAAGAVRQYVRQMIGAGNPGGEQRPRAGQNRPETPVQSRPASSNP